MKRGMSMKKRAALSLLLLLCALMLGGCMQQIQESPMVDLSETDIRPGAKAPFEDGRDDAQMSARLFFLNEDGLALVPVVRSIVAGRGRTRVQAALDALLSGVQEGETGAYWPDLGAARSERPLEISGGTATVDLPAHARTLPQEVLYAVRMAIANTLTEFPEVSYVNVLIGGREEGLDLGGTMPVGTLTQVQDLDAGARYSRLNDQRLSGEGVTFMTTLYFPTRDGAMILPEVRNVTYAQVAPIEYLYTLLEEIGKGSNHALTSRDVPPPMDYLSDTPEITRTEDGAYRAIDIRFMKELDEALSMSGLTRSVYIAMLTDTLLGFVPGVEGLQITIGEERIVSLSPQETPNGQEIVFGNGLAVRSDFVGCVGAPATLYAMDGDTGGLVRVQRVLPQADAAGARERLIALMRLTQEEGMFALPQGLSGKDILAVHVGSEVIAVNLSERFAESLAALTPQQERAAVYAMVNTLTEDTEASHVVFFFEGKQVETLAGALEMRGSFVRNPGMVVE